MQSKGFIKVITVMLVLVCIFYLSFSFVSNRYENKIVKYATEMSGTSDVSNDDYKTYYKQYYDSIANEKVFLNWRTFQQVREMELGLGLDLKGGMNVTLQISVPDILKALSGNNPDPAFNQAIATADSLQRKAGESDFVGTFYREFRKNSQNSLYQIFRKASDKIKPTSTDDEIIDVLKEQVNSMVDNSYNVLRNRIDRFGVVSPNIQKLESTGRILLELPGVKEPERVRKLLQGTANLEFYETYRFQDIESSLAALSAAASTVEAAPADTTATDSVAPVKVAERTLANYLWDLPRTANRQEFGIYGARVGVVSIRDTAAVNKILASADAKRLLPTNLKLCYSVKAVTDGEGLEIRVNGYPAYELVALKTTPQGKPVLNGDVVEDASSEVESNMGRTQNVVSMTMNDEGARQWAQITKNNVGKQVAIVLDDQVYSYPNVNSVIEGGRSQITGNFTPEEANDLGNVLKSGKMVARVMIESDSVIGPSLGEESIKAGVESFVVALVLLMIFMVAVYGMGPGMIANLGLVLNLFFTLGILASFQAVLTLPGIAGIVLALGMAVDANVLIFERSKEELRAGKSVRAAVADGYKNAFSAIFDSNLTSVITGLILFFTGSGPIKGFATTLIIGIACSFFTAVFATRIVMEWMLSKKFGEKVTFVTSLSAKMFNKPNFDFIGARKKGFTVVGVVVVLFALLLSVRGLSRGIDFSGGRNYVVQLENGVNTADVQAALAQEFEGATLSVITLDNNDAKIRVSTNYKFQDGDASVDDEIVAKIYKGMKPWLGDMSEADFSVSNESVGIVSSQKVGPSIAGDMTREAIWAVIFSLIAMALYILVRFRNIAFSLGALAAVAFTAFVIIGIFGFYGFLPFSMEIDQTFIAAILTVIGYQVNDTVVVFDRVRETRTLYPKQDARTTFNNSLNSTLARTIMTSVSTLLVLICIVILGGESIRSFTFAMLMGVIVGTCASLFVAVPTAYYIANRGAKK